jgi:hypothetical protein
VEVEVEGELLEVEWDSVDLILPLVLDQTAQRSTKSAWPAKRPAFVRS